METGEQSQCTHQRQTKVHRPQGFLSSETAMATNYGSITCPWLIETHPGQSVNITMYHFKNLSQGSGHTSSRGYSINHRYSTHQDSHLQIPSSVIVDGINGCQTVDVAVINEAGRQKTVTACSNGISGRIIERYVSSSNALKLHFENKLILSRAGRFLVEYNGNHPLSPISTLFTVYL